MTVPNYFARRHGARYRTPANGMPVWRPKISALLAGVAFWVLIGILIWSFCWGKVPV